MGFLHLGSFSPPAGGRVEFGVAYHDNNLSLQALEITGTWSGTLSWSVERPDGTVLAGETDLDLSTERGERFNVRPLGLKMREVFDEEDGQTHINLPEGLIGRVTREWR